MSGYLSKRFSDKVKLTTNREAENAASSQPGATSKLKVVLEEKESSCDEKNTEAAVGAAPTEVASLETEEAIIRRTARGQLRKELE